MLHLLLKSALLIALSVQAAAAQPINPDAFARARFVTQIDGLVQPQGVVIDSDNLISIAVEGGQRVLVFDQGGALVQTIEKLSECKVVCPTRVLHGRPTSSFASAVTSKSWMRFVALHFSPVARFTFGTHRASSLLI